MAYTPPVLGYDVTGKHPDNYIIGEVASPPLAKNRLLIPIYGAFFSEDFSMVDALTNAPVDSSLYSFADVDGKATEATSKSVYNCIIIDQAAPASVSISYHALGGPNSRNAAFLINWLADRASLQGRTLDWSKVKNKPKRFKPREHLHLLAHVYGMEYVEEALDRLEFAIEQGKESMWLEYNFQIDKKLQELAGRCEVTAMALAQEAFAKAQEEYSLFAIGLDLIENYSVLGDEGNLVAPGNFSVDTMDERYVDLKGLGSFCKGLAKRLIDSSKTNLGLTYGVEWAPQKGSFLGSPQGAVFILPAKKDIAGSSLSNIKVYPSNFPDTDKFVVKRLTNNTFDVGGVFQGWNATTGQVYYGLLSNERCQTPLVWSKAFEHDNLVDLVALVDDHIKANNLPHQETKEQIGLKYVENLPVVSQDEIVTGTGVRKLITVDTLYYHMLTKMEGVKLDWDSQGNVDYTKNPMNDTKIVFVPCDTKLTGTPSTGNGTAATPGTGTGTNGTGGSAINPATGEPYIKPKGQFISSFCDGSDKYTRWTDGNGSYYDELTDKQSDDCEFKDLPKQGDLLSSYCQNQNKFNRYADGRGGSYNELVHVNDPECGYRDIDREGKVLAEYCRGKDLYVRYADGVGGTYELPSYIDTERCGGSIAYGTGGSTGTGGSGGSPAPSSQPKLTFASTHSKIYGGTTEILSYYAQNMIGGQTYRVDWWESSPAVDNGTPYQRQFTTFTANDKGTYIYETRQVDSGTQARGVYKCWLEISLLNISSNSITREFVAGTAPPGGTDPNSGTGTTRPDGGTTGSGGTDNGAVSPPGTTPAPGQTPAPVDVSGNPYNPNNLWPPPVLYSPSINLISSHTIIRPQDNETITISGAGFMANKQYNFKLYYSSPVVNGGTPTLSWSEYLTTDGNGFARLELARYDNGSTPRGTYDNWVVAEEGATMVAKSNNLTRVFADSTTSSAYVYDPRLSLTASHSTVTKDLGYTHTMVLTGGERSALHTVGVRGAFYDSWAGFISFWSATVKTDDKGYFRLEKSFIDDGVTVPRRSYKLSGGSKDSIKDTNSNSVDVTYTTTATSGGGSSGIGYATISYESTQQTVSWTVPETQTITLIRGTPGDKVKLQYWIQSPNFNNNVAYMTTEQEVTVSPTGTGKATVTTTDNGVIPRGNYNCWAVCPEYKLTSSTIVRTFVVNPTGTPAPTPTQTPGPGGTPAPTTTPAPTPDPLANATIIYSTSTPTVYPGVTETHTIQLVGFIPNTTYDTSWFIRSPALNNGNAPFNSWNKALGAPTVTTNSAGAATLTATTVDNGTVVPRGVYSCWIEISGKTSNSVTRTFAEKQAPAPTYKPTLNFATNRPGGIQPGMSETQTWSIAAAAPNTNITIRWWIQSSVFNGGASVISLTQNATTNAQGVATNSFTNSDDGSLTRGAYNSWVECPEYGIISNKIVRNFIAAPVPTDPPYNPRCNYSTSHSKITLGTTETFYLSISGMKPNTGYSITLYTTGTWSGTASKSITTNSTGSGSISWSDYDNGVVPRGSYNRWAVIDATGTSSNTFSVVFA